MIDPAPITNTMETTPEINTNKHRMWLIIGITAAILIIAFLIFLSVIKVPFSGKAIGAQCTVDSDCDLIAGEICVSGICSLPTFNLDLQCPSSVSPGQTFQCDIILDRPVTGFFGAQFVINAPGFSRAQPFIQGRNNVLAYSSGLGTQTLVFKSTADGQPAGAVATISLVSVNRMISNVFLSDLIIATGSTPAQVSVTGSSLVGGICTVNSDCVQGVSCSTNGICGGSSASCTQNSDCITGLCQNLVCSRQSEICNDGLDNDNDGSKDCSDTDCITDPSCSPTGISQCRDGIDNDQDSFIDLWGGCDIDGDGDVDVTHYLITSSSDCPSNKNCPDGTPETPCFFFSDPLCVSSQGVAEGEVCTNGVDDDSDSLIDCADPSCTTDSACVVTILTGDVTGNAIGTPPDGAVNILDVLAVIGHIIADRSILNNPNILTGNAFIAANADCDINDAVNIQDVLAIIMSIITQTALPMC